MPKGLDSHDVYLINYEEKKQENDSALNKEAENIQINDGPVIIQWLINNLG